MDKDELKEVVERGIKGLSTYFEAKEYLDAISEAERDTGFTLPTSVAFQIKWLIERTKRSLFFMLYTESAHKFKAKQFNLQHRFEHYGKLIKTMDTDFLKVQEEEMFQFAGVNPKQAFGHLISSGFASDSITGKDITYETGNRVKINPSDTE
jgi:hypothetical protein